eukprot:3819236-Rhodomonas_salina.12
MQLSRALSDLGRVWCQNAGVKRTAPALASPESRGMGCPGLIRVAFGDASKQIIAAVLRGLAMSAAHHKSDAGLRPFSAGWHARSAGTHTDSISVS